MEKIAKTELKPSSTDAVKDENKVSIAANITDLRRLIRQGEVSTQDIQRALQCGYPTARRIIDAFEFCPIDKKYDGNFFSLTEEEQADYLESLIFSNLFEYGYDIDTLLARVRYEFVRICELKLVTSFLLAKAVADVLSRGALEPNFVGVGCCSLIAYILGIPGERLDPIERGLIFERGFPKSDKKIDGQFGFYVEKKDCDNLLNQIKKQFGEDVCFVESNDDFLLSVNGENIRIFSTIDELQKIYLQLDKSMDSSRIGVFQEDYMRLFHFIAGYSYDEANNARKTICKMNTKEIAKLKKDFVMSSGGNLSSMESEQVFDDIVKGLPYAPCKAWVLAAKEILDEVLPF